MAIPLRQRLLLMSKLTHILALAYIYACTLSPAAACFVCMGDEDGRTNAYRFMTAFMTLLPFIVIGTFLFWLKKRATGNPS